MLWMASAIILSIRYFYHSRQKDISFQWLAEYPAEWRLCIIIDARIPHLAPLS
jgi:hypothetical protein